MVEEIDYRADESRVLKFVLGNQKLTGERGRLGGSGHPGCGAYGRQQARSRCQRPRNGCEGCKRAQ